MVGSRARTIGREVGVCPSNTGGFIQFLQLMVGLVMHKDRKVGQRTSGILLCFWILMTVYGSLKLRTYILTGLDKVRVYSGNSFMPNSAVPVLWRLV